MKRVLPVVGVLLLFALLLSLGFWQLNRAEQKRKLFARQQQSLQTAVLPLDEQDAENWQTIKFRTVSVSGIYDGEHQFLLDNQHVDGKVGYFVFTPLRLGVNKSVLVNRGWVPLNKDRRILPNVTLTQKQVTITGRINGFPGVGIVLAGAETPSKTWPAVVQVVNVQALAKLLQTDLHTFQIELDGKESDGYVRRWRIIQEMTAEKHVAYALQWFGLAITLLILFFWTNYKKHPNDSATT